MVSDIPAGDGKMANSFLQFLLDGNNGNYSYHYHQVAVYAPDERADTLPLFHLYPYVLCGYYNSAVTH